MYYTAYDFKSICLFYAGRGDSRGLSPYEDGDGKSFILVGTGSVKFEPHIGEDAGSNL